MSVLRLLSDIVVINGMYENSKQWLLCIVLSVETDVLSWAVLEIIYLSLLLQSRIYDNLSFFEVLCISQWHCLCSFLLLKYPSPFLLFRL